MRRSLAGLACVALLATGCGSTVRVGSGALGSDAGLGSSLGSTSTSSGTVPTDSDGQPLAGGTAGSTGSGTSGTVVSRGASSTIGGRGSAGTTGAAGSPGSTAAQPKPGETGRGFDAKTLTVGVVIITGTDSAAKAFGVSGGSTGDPQAQYDAVTAHINASGGIAGRTLKLLYHSVDLLTAVNNPDQAVAQVCAAFTEDNKVFAVLQPLPTAQQRDCLAKADTPMIEAGTSLIGQPEYDKYPNLLFGPGRMNTDRLISLLFSSLDARSFFTGWDTLAGGPGKAPVKLGLLYPETPDTKYMVALERRELAARGMRFDDEISYPANLNAGLSATQNAILKFKADGITHVFGASVFFLQGAEQQQYRPRYVIAPGVGQLYAANSPAAQMAGSMTVGWQPPHDVNQSEDPGDVSPAETRCKKIMAASGQSYAAREALASMVGICDVEFFLRDALAGKRAISNAVLRSGADALGSGWQSAQTWISRFSASKHASADAVRDQAFNAECTCMVYTSTKNRTT